MKRIISYSTILAVLLLLFVPTSAPVSAEGIKDLDKKINELKDQQKELNEEKGNLNSEAKSTEEKISQNQQKQTQVNQQITNLQNEIEQTKKNITNKEQEIATNEKDIEETDNEIKQLKEEIEELQERITKRDELLKNRLRSLQQSGGNISYLEVLMGAQSFGDFLNRATVVNRIMDQDKTIMETHVSEKNTLEQKQVEVEEKKKSLEEKKVTLEEQKQDLINLQSSLANKVDELEDLMKELQIEETELHDYKLTLEEEQEIKRKEAAALKKAIEQAKEEKERLEQLAASKNNGGDSYGNAPDNGKLFGWPAATTRVTSPFDMNRYLSYYGYVKPHYGMDFATGNSNDIVPIFASASGVVNTVFKNHSAYGNAVIITHYLNGKVYTTLYAHMRNDSVTVTEGQSVTRGQKIGLMGTTGASTGQHLHFQIHEGGFSKYTAVNPAKYLY